MTILDPTETASGPDDGAALGDLVRADQFAGVRRSLAIAVPVNFFLSAATFAVGAHFGHVWEGALWFVAASAVNLARIVQIGMRPGRRGAEAITVHLKVAAFLSALSGIVWAFTPFLSAPSETTRLFNLIVGAGITGGSIAMGFAFAPVALCFVTPILLSQAVWLLFARSFEETFLAGTILIYLGALARSAVQTEKSFVDSTRLKHQATRLAASLHLSHSQTLAVAEEMSHLARHDSLTSLLNRAGFVQELERRATMDRPLCVMMLDLDGFKSINDAFGHTVGDGILVETARRITPELPAGSAVARLGGDEFAIVFDPADTEASPATIAERLVAAIGAPVGPFRGGRLGVSAGIYVGPVPSVADVLVFADKALYAAKDGGRNRASLFDETLRKRLEMRRDSERDLLCAIESRDVQLWYQPIFGDGGRRLDGVEALLRWNHPRHGWISPADIIAAAALSGHADRLFRYIAGEACEMARLLRTGRRGNLTVSINVSPREMSQLSIDTIVIEALAAAGLASDAIEIEVTEETALDIQAVAPKLDALSRAGIRIAIDDFGVGYSSLSSLRQLHADRIKIDRCFVTDLASSADNRMLLQAVISLGRAMNLDVVAEGVETAHDVVILRALGCQFMQGYHLGRPMPAEAMLETLAAPAAAAQATTAVA
jgi:diguanylate cyclase (GGDEF)-like protein